MRLVTFDEGKVGQLSDEKIAELDVPTMRAYFERGGTPTGREHALEDVKLRAPILPKKFIHTAGNFREHEEESKRVGWSHEIAPWIVFFQNVDAIIGPDEAIVYPDQLTSELDYELELAVVVSKPGKWFTPEEAADYIGGYVIFNDITARDIQRREMRSGVFSFCKGIDTFCPLGPWMETGTNPADLELTTTVNGEIRQQARTSELLWDVPGLIAYVSQVMTLLPGDVLLTGTPAGVGPLTDGDEVSVTIESIGTLTNRVVIGD